MTEIRQKSFTRPDGTVEFPNICVQQVELGDFTVGHLVLAPGWRWYDHVRPRIGGEWCEARHVGVVVSGRFGVTMRDGTTAEFGPEDVFEIPPEHDGYTIGEDPCHLIEWTGLHKFAGYRMMGAQTRALATLLFTDIVDSTATAARLGDGAWRELLSTHFESTRQAVELHAGREVNTTGDGFLATFEGPAAALRCAEVIVGNAQREGLSVRAGVHVGEVELVGTDVRGIAVHEAARIMSVAKANDIVVSSTTRALARGSGFEFESRGVHTLKGLDGDWELFALI